MKVCLESNISGMATEIKMVFKINVLQWMLYFAFAVCRVTYLIWNDFISNDSSPKFGYDYNHHHHHHVVLVARISLTLSRHFSQSFIASGRSSGLHPVSSHSCWMYVRADRPAFARPYVGVHRSTSLISSSLRPQQCPACLVCLTWIVFVMEGRLPYSWCLVGVLPPGIVQDCSQHSCVIAA